MGYDVDGWVEGFGFDGLLQGVVGGGGPGFGRGEVIGGASLGFVCEGGSVGRL